MRLRRAGEYVQLIVTRLQSDNRVQRGLRKPDNARRQTFRGVSGAGCFRYNSGKKIVPSPNPIPARRRLILQSNDEPHSRIPA